MNKRNSVIIDDDLTDKIKYTDKNTHSVYNGTAKAFYCEPTNIIELLETDKFYECLAKSFIFIHNQKESSDYLIDDILNFSQNIFEFHFLQTHSNELFSILNRIESTKPSKKRHVLIIDFTSTKEDVNEFCLSVYSVKQLNIGVWIRSYLADFKPVTITLFDALFIFDMSYRECEIFRSVVNVSRSTLKNMQICSNDKYNILFFLNKNRLSKVRFLTTNPILLTQTKRGYRMDFTPFVPVLVEATKLFFNEISKFIVEIRKKSSSTPDFPISKEELEKAEDDPRNILSLINSSITLNDIDEIKTLVEQIKLNQCVARELETQEAVASGEELAKIRMLIKRKHEVVIDKSVRLNDLLKQVYRVK